MAKNQENGQGIVAKSLTGINELDLNTKDVGFLINIIVITQRNEI